LKYFVFYSRILLAKTQFNKLNQYINTEYVEKINKDI
jgi:hypothetical protein